MTLKSGLNDDDDEMTHVTERLKVVPFKSLGAVSYSMKCMKCDVFIFTR